MTTKVATFPLRLPVSLKSAIETISDRDGTSMNQFLVIAAGGHARMRSKLGDYVVAFALP